jgi:hypothetical protein
VRGNHQQGFNLISLMIGMVISLITVLAMLSLYRTLVGISVESASLAKVEGQKASGLLTAQIALQQAGFGLPVIGTKRPQLGRDLVFIRDATLSKADENNVRKLSGGTVTDFTKADPVKGSLGNAIIWGFNTSTITETPTAAAYQCSGLVSTSSGLVLLKPVRCTSPQAWASLDWSTADLINEMGSDTQGAYMQIVDSTCWPFSTNEGVHAVQVRFPVLDLEPQPEPLATSFTTCLSNFAP